MSSLPTSEPSASVGPDRLTQNLLTLLRTPTEVPAGAHELHPGDARIVSAVEEVVVPRIAELGPDELRRHPDGDVVARFGPAGDDGLLLQTYIVSQHGNLMSEPHDARVEDGGPYGIAGPVARGQGANQNKGPMAAALSAVAQRPATLRRPVLLTVNTEGRSHDGSRRIIDEVGTRAAAGVLAFATDLKVSVANRGRVDVQVVVPGSSCHSSQPHLGVNPIERAADVVHALRSTPLPMPHPDLGPATATPYQLSFSPVAPTPSRSKDAC